MISDDMTTAGSIRMNFMAYKSILSAHIQPNPAKTIGQCFTVQMDNDTKHTAKATQGRNQGTKMGYSSVDKSAT